MKKSGKLKIDTDPNLKVTSIQNPDYVYNGQVKSVANTRRQLAAGSESTHLVSQGIGQQYGTWGIYEGQFDEGKITGYGRIIMPNQDVYEGNCVDGSYDGFGVLTMKDGTEKSGTWKKNQLVLNKKGDKVSY